MHEIHTAWKDAKTKGDGLKNDKGKAFEDSKKLFTLKLGDAIESAAKVKEGGDAGKAWQKVYEITTKYNEIIEKLKDTGAKVAYRAGIIKVRMYAEGRRVQRSGTIPHTGNKK